MFVFAFSGVELLALLHLLLESSLQQLGKHLTQSFMKTFDLGLLHSVPLAIVVRFFFESLRHSVLHP